MQAYRTDNLSHTCRRLDAAGVPYTRITIRLHNGRTCPGIALSDSAQIVATVGRVASQN